MKFACALLLAAGCAGSSKSSSPTTAPTGSATTTTDTAAGSGTKTTATTTTTTTASPAGAYSCFSYMSGTTKHFGCAPTNECDDYVEQARAVGGLRDLSSCATVDAVICFHQAPSKTDAEGSDVCQPTMEACASERAALVRAGQSADSDCAKR